MFYDFEQVKREYPIVDVATRLLGLELKQETSPNYWRGTCPYCDTERTFRVTVDKGLAGCFDCKRRNIDCIALVAHVRGLKMNEAAGYIIEQMGGPMRNSRATSSTVSPTSRSTVEVPTPAPAKPLTDSRPSSFDRAKYQAGLDRTNELLKDIPKDFLERADIGVSNRGALKGIVLPTYDKDTGEFICYVKVEGLELPKATVTRLKTA